MCRSISNIKFGYRLSEDGVTLVKDEGEQMVIEAIRIMWSIGLSSREIADRLRASGYVPKT